MVIYWGLHYTLIVYICLKTVMNILTQLGIETQRTLLRSIWICHVVLQELQGICTIHLVGVTAPCHFFREREQVAEKFESQLLRLFISL